jgi:nitrate reductase NapAB chaperone NapD
VTARELKRKIPRKAAVGIGIVAILLAVSSALAVHDATGPMQLEGNIADADPDNDPQDWGSIFGTDGLEIPANLPAGTLDTTNVIVDFDIGATGPDESYHEPSNKDDQAINAAGGGDVWGCVSVPNATDKTDIVNAYGMAVQGDAQAGDGDTADDQLFYFGVERFDNSGDAFIGLWLFQDDVTCDSAGTGKFNGSKQTGDILVLANFTGGGSDATIQLFRYTAGVGDAAGTFDDLVTVTGKCEVTGTGDLAFPGNDICATLNDTASVVTPWAMEDKQKPGPPSPDVVKTLEPDQFVEGGVNLTDIFLGAGLAAPPCFGSFLAETRSSASIDATLKDYALGDLQFCDADISITPTETNRVGELHTFTVDVDQKVGSGDQAATVGDVEYTLTGGGGIEAGDIVIDGGTCVNAVGVEDDLDANGQCTIIFHSDVAGTVTGHATVEVDVGGTTLTRATDGTGNNSGDAVKTYVDAFITVAADDTNRVDDSHTFTVHVEGDSGSGSADYAGAFPVITFPGGAPGTVNATDCTTNGTDSNGDCDVIVSSSVTGSFDIHAAASVTLAGLTFSVETDGLGNNSGDATKVFVDATIDITGDDTNRIGAAHTFTVTVKSDDGGGGGLVTVGAGQDVDVTLAVANGAVVVLDTTLTTCDVPASTHDGAGTDASGQCVVVFTSNNTGTVTGTASALMSYPNSLSFTVDTSTDAETTGNESAVKTFVDATIDITGDDTNRVGDPHTFTVTLKKDDGGASGLQPVGAGEDVDVTMTDADGSVYDLDTTLTTCDVVSAGETHDGGGTDANGQCVVVFTSDSTGATTGTASALVSFPDSLSFTVDTSTDAETAGNESAVKGWVDAQIGIEGDDTNGIGEQHTFTVTLEKDPGDGFVGAGPGEDVDVTLVEAGGATYVLDTVATTCDVVGDGETHDGAGTDANGVCVVVFTSNSAGTVTGSAESTLTVSTVEITVSTDDTGSTGDVVKIFLSGTLVWHKVDGNGAPLGGATFEVCRTATLDTSTDPETLVDDDPDICVSVLDNDTTPGVGEAADEDPADGEFLMTGLILGTYTVRETAAPAGYHIGNPDAVSAGSHSLDADPDVLDLEIEDPFVNLRAFRLIVIGCDDITDLLEETEVWIDLNDDDIVDPGEVLNTITVVPPHLDDLGVTEADICGTEDDDVDSFPDDGIGGASFGGLAPRLYHATMQIPLL